VEQPAADAQHLCILVDRDLDRPILVALVDRVGEMLAPVFDPFDRALEQLGCGHDGDVFRIDAELGAKAAADVGRRDAQLVRLEIHQRIERLEQVMRLLRGRPYRDPAVGCAEFR